MTEPTMPSLSLVHLAADEAVGYCDPQTGACVLPGANEPTSDETATPNGPAESGDGLDELRPAH